MRTIWVHRDIDAPAEVVWALLTDVDAWPRWGPSVRSAEVTGGCLEAGATGSVTTVLGIRLPFEITALDEMRWAWKVGGLTATDHRVRALAPDRCRAGIGVPWPAAPYLAVCRAGLRRLESLATRHPVDAHPLSPAETEHRR